MAIEDYFSYPEFGSYDLRKYRVPAPGNPAMAYGPNEYVEFPMYMDNQVVLPAPLPVTPPAVMPSPVAPSAAMPTPAVALPQPQGIAPASVLPIPQKRMAPSINFDQFPIPTPPPARQMPMRDLAGERRQQSQVSLRAGLIGLLLGGGTGALGALTGAQQGFQQAADEDYQQRLAGFQSEQQQAQQDYSNRVAMTNAMLARAQAERQQGQEFLDTDYANMIATRNEQVRLETERLKEAERRQEITKDERDARIRALQASQYYTSPEQAMDFAMTGQIPQAGLTPVRSVKRLEPAQARLLVDRFMKEIPFMTAQDFASRRAGLKSVLMDPSNEEFVKNLIRMVPQTKPSGYQTAESARIAIQEARTRNAKKAQDERTRQNARMYDLALRRVNNAERNIDSLIKARAAAKGAGKGEPNAGPKLTAYQAAATKAVEEIHGMIKDRNAAVQKQKQGLLDDDDVAYIGNLDAAIAASIEKVGDDFAIKPTLDQATNNWTIGRVKVLTQPPAAGKSKYQFSEVK